MLFKEHDPIVINPALSIPNSVFFYFYNFYKHSKQSSCLYAFLFLLLILRYHHSLFSSVKKKIMRYNSSILYFFPFFFCMPIVIFYLQFVIRDSFSFSFITFVSVGFSVSRLFKLRPLYSY